MPASTTPIYSSPLSQSTTTTTQKKTPFQQQPAQKKRIMSITQTYYLAHKARAKLSSEAARSDHDLRLLVGHANLLDSLMLELADAEREQESWFNQSVRGATHHEEEKAEKKEQHIRWADSTIAEEQDEEEDEWLADDAASVSSDDSSDSDFDSEDEDAEMADLFSLRRLPSTAPAPAKPLLSVEEDDDMEEDDLEEDYAQLELVRTTSHSNSPPELIEHDLDSDSSDDESMPPSPPNTILTFSEKEAKEQQSKFYPEASIFRKSSPTSIVSAISVY